jgi:hypothetical protein
LQSYDHLFGAFFTNVEISTNRPTSTSKKIGNLPLIIEEEITQLCLGPKEAVFEKPEESS